MAGIFYGWMGLYYGNLAQMVDTWALHNFGLYEYHLLRNDTGAYFGNFFRNPYENGMENFFGSSNSFWNDLKGNMFVKMLSVFDVLSFGHYYINVIFISFLTFFGPIAFYRVMTDVFPGRKIILLITTFLLPSFLYWTGGIHKEGLLFLAIALIVFHMYFGGKNGYRFRNYAGIMGGLLLLLIFRNFLLFLVLPAMIAWLIAQRWKGKSLLAYVIVYSCFSILFFTAKNLHARLDFPQEVVNKQQAFLKLQPGNSTVTITELEPTVGSFIKNTPQAITLTVIRPYPSDVNHLLSLAASLEINLLLLSFLIFLIWRKKSSTDSNLIYFCIFLSFTVLLAIGFTVNNLGAIVRYRSIILPLLIVPMAAQTDWAAMTRWVSNIINKNNIQKTP